MTYHGTRTKDLYTSRGFNCAKVEHWNAFAKIRQDMFGFIDLYCFKFGEPDIGVQYTTRENISHHLKKIAEIPVAADWLNCGKRIIIVGWEKVGGRWEHTDREVTINDILNYNIPQESSGG